MSYTDSLGPMSITVMDCNIIIKGGGVDGVGVGMGMIGLGCCKTVPSVFALDRWVNGIINKICPCHSELNLGEKTKILTLY